VVGVVGVVVTVVMTMIMRTMVVARVKVHTKQGHRVEHRAAPAERAQRVGEPITTAQVTTSSVESWVTEHRCHFRLRIKAAMHTKPFLT